MGTSAVTISSVGAAAIPMVAMAFVQFSQNGFIGTDPVRSNARVMTLPGFPVFFANSLCCRVQRDGGG